MTLQGSCRHSEESKARSGQRNTGLPCFPTCAPVAAPNVCLLRARQRPRSRREASRLWALCRQLGATLIEVPLDARSDDASVPLRELEGPFERSDTVGGSSR